jgi:hypothetical protein
MERLDQINPTPGAKIPFLRFDDAALVDEDDREVAAAGVAAIQELARLMEAGTVRAASRCSD